ncbi:MAG: hypothetical protein MUC91_08635 [Verrucomicrobia bacterium]|nr:hypothetical protein [Verrucomicrobiota bacterium]
MEIKIECGCGTRFSFDVEPKNGRMPCAVSCPNCQADATEQANQSIQQQTGAPKPRLKIPTPSPAASAPSPPPPANPTSRPRKAAPKAKRPAPSRLSFLWKTVLPLLAVGFIVFSVGKKWLDRAKTVATVLSSESSDEAGTYENNFSFEDAVFLYVKHPDSAAVAQASLEFLSQHLKRPGAVTNVLEDLEPDFGTNDWYVFPSHNGYVSMYTGLQCQRPVYNGLAQHLSSKFSDTVMVYRDVDFTGEFYFGVFQSGDLKMSGEMKLAGSNLLNAEETTTFTGEEWAREHGYVEDSKKDEFYEKFHWGHAEAISKNLGLKLWDQEYDESRRPLWLRLF